MADETTPTETSTAEATAESAPEVAVVETETTENELGTTALGGGEEGETTETAETTEEAAPEVPETYELETPEGFEKLDEETVAAATPVFKELGLTNEQANKLVPVAGAFAKRIIETRDQQLLGTILEQRKTWLTDAKADQEIGGQNWDASIRESARALDNLGFPKGSPLRVALDESGFGNHPELIRLMSRVGKAIGEDSDFVRSDAGAAVKPKSDAELFYGSKE